MDIDKVRAILHSGNFGTFIGEIEDQRFECKLLCRADLPHEKRELAKDISGMANGGGGFIVVGLATTSADDRPDDIVTEIKLVRRQDFTAAAYRDTLKSWVYPVIEGLEVEWVASPVDPGKGLGYFFIPAQPENLKPFLLSRFVEENGRTSEMLFAHCERRRDNVNPTSVPRLHTLLQAGLFSQRFSAQMENIEKLLEGLSRSAMPDALPTVSTVGDVEMAARITEALIACDLGGKAAYILTAKMRWPTTIPTLFRSSSEPVVELLATPQQIRRNGFSLNRLRVKPDIVGGNRRRAVESRRTVLELWPDGTVIFGASGGENFLCWPPRLQDAPKPECVINSIVLVETAFLFAELCEQILRHLRPSVKSVEISVELRDMGSGSTFSTLAVPGVIQGTTHLFSAGSMATGANMRKSIDVDFSDFDCDSGRVAFEVAAPVFEHHNVEHEQIPYQSPKGHISADLLKRA